MPCKRRTQIWEKKNRGKAIIPEDLMAGEKALGIPSVLHGELASFYLLGVSMVLGRLGVSWRPGTTWARGYKLSEHTRKLACSICGCSALPPFQGKALSGQIAANNFETLGVIFSICSV